MPWIKSTHSNPSGNCIETYALSEQFEMLVRDSKNKGGGILHFTSASWARFTDSIKSASNS